MLPGRVLRTPDAVAWIDIGVTPDAFAFAVQLK